VGCEDLLGASNTSPASWEIGGGDVPVGFILLNK